ncbi:uncharacterized protein [Diadema setosum]|uniref:uncharacterized protein n=1 Tax=Diadema setosum TaxID=31175 RepID=UPI003B3BB58E
MGDDVIVAHSDANSSLKSPAKNTGILSLSTLSRMPTLPLDPPSRVSAKRPVQMVYPAMQRLPSVKGSEDGDRHVLDLTDSDPDVRHVDECNAFDAIDLAKSFRPKRKQRDFVPNTMKDSKYWNKRVRNNIAAKRSREKRRLADMLLESKVSKLAQENEHLRTELDSIKLMVQEKLLKESGKERPQYASAEISAITSNGDYLSPPPQKRQRRVPVAAHNIPQTFPSAYAESQSLHLPNHLLPPAGSDLSGYHLHTLRGTQPELRIPEGPTMPWRYPATSLPRENLPPSLPLPNAVVGPPVWSKMAVTPQRPLLHPGSHELVPPRMAIPNGPLIMNAITAAKRLSSPLPENRPAEKKQGSEPTDTASQDTPCEGTSGDNLTTKRSESDFGVPSLTPTSSLSHEGLSSAEINKLPHKLRGKLFRSRSMPQEPATSTQRSQCASPPKDDLHVVRPGEEPHLDANRVLANIKKELDDDIESTADAGGFSFQAEEHPGTPVVKLEGNSAWTGSIEAEVEEARNVIPDPNRTMSQDEADAYAQLVKAAAALVDARLQVKEFSMPTVRQLTRQRTRDMSASEKYRDKRVRNNIAAKKCRDAKRLLTEYRAARSKFFELENVNLRNEMKSLTEDVIRLRELLMQRELMNGQRA